MKKMLLATALALLITGCTSTRLLFKTNPGSSSTKGKPSPIISAFRIGQKEKLSPDAAKICGGAENVSNRNPANIRVGLLGFITLGIYTPLEARVLLTIIA